MATIAFASAGTQPPLQADDALAIAPLAALGHQVVPLVWNAGPLPAQLDAVVVRACWDYHREVAGFRAWLDALAARGLAVINPVPLLRWNLDKHYLRELAAAGVPIPQTVFVPSGPAPQLDALLAAHGIDEAVVKPAISLSADRTWRCDRASARARQRDFEAMLVDRGALVQAFVPEVLRDGELSLVFFDGEFSHAVRKRPRAGDFRVQADHGGSREPADPPPWVTAQARQGLGHAPQRSSYARVDGIVVGDRFVLMELELIDPVLFLAAARHAAVRFAAAIDAALSRRRSPTRTQLAEALLEAEGHVVLRLRDGAVLEGWVVDVRDDALCFEHAPSPLHAQALGSASMAPPARSIALDAIEAVLGADGSWRAMPPT
ncbi:MAG: hypothetical protein U0168_12570 [Nannocystaceae bacterium]